MKTIIIDEIHLLGDETRGPALESLVLKFRGHCSIVGLSATLSNRDEVAHFLNASVVTSRSRPVDLEIQYMEPRRALGGQELLFMLLREHLGDQTLVFVQSRREAEALAFRALHELPLQEVTNTIAMIDIDPNVRTQESDGALDALVRHGVGFHHAALTSEQRKRTEVLF